MKYTSELDTAKGICRVCVSGRTHAPTDGDELKLFARDFFVEHGCCHFLFDMRQAEVIIGTMDAYAAGAPNGEMATALKPFQVAVVVQEVSQDLSFFESVAVNRGFMVNVFDDVDKAVKWLKPEDDNP